MPSSIASRSEGKVTSSRDLHPKNEQPPKNFIPSGITIFFRLLIEAKAYPAMNFTFEGTVNSKFCGILL